MVHPDLFGEDGRRSSRHSENQLQVVDYDEDNGNQNGKPSTLSTLPFAPYSAYSHYFHSFLQTLVNAPPSKHFH